MNTQNLTALEKEIYQQPMLKVIAVQTSRCCVLNVSGGDSELGFGGNEIE